MNLSLLACFKATGVVAHVREAEFIKEVEDEIRQLNGEATTLDICRQAAKTFAASQSEEDRNALRNAYEAVPEHERRFLGDMDVKDIPIRMVIYGEDQIENWSHRIAGRQLGMDPLPMIHVKGALPARKERPWWKFWKTGDAEQEHATDG